MLARQPILLCISIFYFLKGFVSKASAAYLFFLSWLHIGVLLCCVKNIFNGFLFALWGILLVNLIYLTLCIAIHLELTVLHFGWQFYDHYFIEHSICLWAIFVIIPLIALLYERMPACSRRNWGILSVLFFFCLLLTLSLALLAYMKEEKAVEQRVTKNLAMVDLYYNEKLVNRLHTIERLFARHQFELLDQAIIDSEGYLKYMSDLKFIYLTRHHYLVELHKDHHREHEMVLKACQEQSKMKLFSSQVKVSVSSNRWLCVRGKKDNIVVGLQLQDLLYSQNQRSRDDGLYFSLLPFSDLNHRLD